MKNLLTLILINSVAFIALAQAPQKFSYQSVIRNAGNQLVANQNVGIKIFILQGTATGSAVYAETHSPLTNANGLASLEIGAGTVLSGNFASINWANGPYFVKTETDPNGGSNYTITNTSQLLSVPYALYASSASNGVPNGGTNGQFLTNCNGVATWTTAGQCPGTIASFDCASAINVGTLTALQSASGVSSTISYAGGGGGTHNGQTVTSTGVTGLTATLSAGTFANGAGSLTYIITGTPATSGTASFALSIGGQTCSIALSVSTSLTLGSFFQGGRIIYIYQPGDQGYISGETHGLIISENSISTTPSNVNNSWVNLPVGQFGCIGTFLGNTSTTFGAGPTNTTSILAICNSTQSAAYYCDTLSINGYNDWFLPSKSEVSIIYQNYTVVGGVYPTQSQGVWSSSEINASNGWVCSFDGGGGWVSLPKNSVFAIKPLRKF